MISYRPLRVFIANKKVKLTDLNEILPTSVTSKFNKDESVTLTTIDKICQFWNCSISDIVEILPDPQLEGKEE